MGRKIDKPQPAQASAPEDVDAEAAQFAAQEAEQQEILHPERGPQINGRYLTVREYGFIEGMKLQSVFKPFLTDLFAQFSRTAGPPPAAVVRGVMADHALAVQWMMAQAISPEEDSDEPQAFLDEVRTNSKWVGALGEDDGDLLMSIWWVVNRNFFSRRLREQAEVAATTTPNQSLPPDSTQP